MKLNYNLALVIVLFGVVGLISSFWSIGDMIFTKDPAKIFNPDYMRGVVDTAAWLSTFSIVAIGFGLYNWDETLLAVFGNVGISFSILLVVPLFCLGFINSFNSNGLMPEVVRLIKTIGYINILFIAAIIFGSRNSGQK